MVGVPFPSGLVGSAQGGADSVAAHSQVFCGLRLIDCRFALTGVRRTGGGGRDGWAHFEVVPLHADRLELEARRLLPDLDRRPVATTRATLRLALGPRC